MSPVSLFLVFLMIWLIVFFMSLPFGWLINNNILFNLIINFNY